MDVASLEVTVNGSQVSVDPIGNGTKPFDDVKVMLVKGIDGTGAESLAPAFSPSTYYAYGDLCTKDALLYQCNTRQGHEGAWDASDFDVVDLEDIIVRKTGDTMTGTLRVDDTDYSNYAATKDIRAYDGKFNIKFTSAANFTITYKTGESQESTKSGNIPYAYQADRYHIMVYESGHVDEPPIAERAVSSVSDVTIDYGSPQMSVIIRIYRYGYSELSVEHLLADVVEDGKGNVLSEKYNTSDMIPIRATVLASNWSETPTSGYYTYTLTVSKAFASSPTPDIKGTGADDTTPPTDAQIDAYNQITLPFGYVEHYSTDTFKLYAKKKPTSDFYILITGREI